MAGSTVIWKYTLLTFYICSIYDLSAGEFDALLVLFTAKISQVFEFSCSSFFYAYTPQYYQFMLSTGTNFTSDNTLTETINAINVPDCATCRPCKTSCKLAKGTLAAIIYIFMGLKWYTTSKRELASPPSGSG